MSTRRHFLLTAATTAAAFPMLAQQTPAGPIAALKDRSQEALAITPAERQTRADKARHLMQQRGIAALCITGGTSLVYFTGIRSGQSERLFAWILPASGDPYIVCPVFEEARMTEQIGSIPDGKRTKVLTWNEDEDPCRLLVKHLPEGRLALDERVQFVFADGIQKADPWRRIVSAIPIVAGCRALKSPAELACMQLANDITLAVYKAAWQTAGPGTTNRQFVDLIAQGYKTPASRAKPPARSASGPPFPTARPARKPSAKATWSCSTTAASSTATSPTSPAPSSTASHPTNSAGYSTSSKPLSLPPSPPPAPASPARPSTQPPARSSPTPASAPTTAPSPTA